MKAFFVTRNIQMLSLHGLRHLDCLPHHWQRWPEAVGSPSGSRLRADGGPVRLSVTASMALLVILFASGSGNGQGHEEQLQSQSRP